MPAKTKMTQPKNDTSGRNNFQTPLYAVEMLLPFILLNTIKILEPCAGQMRLVDYFKNQGFQVEAYDLFPQRKDCGLMNFLDMRPVDMKGSNILITNPPFSLKFEFISKALSLGIPFAFLIPFDMCGFLHDLFMKYNNIGAIVPSRRIDYLTPNIVKRVNDGETLANCNKLENTKHKNWEKFLEEFGTGWSTPKKLVVNYKKIDDIPVKIIKKYSSSDFHSFWITYKLNLPKQFTFVDLSLEDKKNVV